MTDPTTPIAPVPMIERRRIEAQILGQVYDALQKRMSRDEAQEFLREVVSASAIAQGRSMAGDGPAPTLEDFAALTPLWTVGGTLEIDYRERGPEVLRFDVTRCGYAEMYHAMGLGEIGHILSCTRDGDFCIGYNPQITLERTQTIMQGAPHCDFCYRMARKD